MGAVVGRRGVELDGVMLDNGQHILIGAYSATLALMRRVGVDPDALLARRPLELVYPDGSGLRLPTGEVVPLDRGVILGRKPAPAEGSTDWPHLVHLPSDHSFVSRRHLQVELDGWDVVARDLDSRGGTTITYPGREPQRMRPDDAYVLESGTVLDMAQVYAVRFETGAVAR